METSVILAKIIGPLFVVVGLGLFINLDHYRRMLSDFGSSPLSIYMAGTTALLLGLIVVTFHNVWVVNWPVIITLLGWSALIKGAVRIAAPRLVADRAGLYARNTNVITASALVTLVLGGILTYFGYAAAS
jgi:uncharacterized protein YjeT (DUF2065 family)